MNILEAHVTKARMARDFGMVEANVTLLIEHPGSAAPLEVNILTCAPRPTRLRPGALRAQLVRNAARLYAKMAGIAFPGPAAQITG